MLSLHTEDFNNMNKLQALIEQALYETNEYGITHQKTDFKVEETYWQK